MEKLFYNKDGKVQNIKIEQLLKTGIDTKTYKTLNNECLKVFVRECADEQLFQIMSKINLDNFYKINDLLYDKEGRFIAYKTKFYQKEDIDILTMPIDYTIENMTELYKTSDILSNNNIRIEDLHHQNVILNKNNIIIVDADRYTYEPNNNHIEFNRQFINTLFTLLYMTSSSMNSLIPSQNYYDTFKSIRQLFINNTPETVHKKLTRYKYPIDYLKRNTQ